MPIRLMVVDNHRLFREGIKSILSDAKDIIVVAEGSDGETAIANAAIYNPDIILLDIALPGMSGIDALRGMKEQGIRSKIIILSGQSNKKNIIASIKLGANGFINKDNNSEKLIDIIRKVCSGENYLQPSLGKILRHNIEDEPIDVIDDINVRKIESLSTREYEILILMSSGCNNKAIAKELFISEKTVKNHITSIFKKLAVKDRVQAVIFAFANEMV